MKNYIVEYKNFINKSVCDDIIDLFNENKKLEIKKYNVKKTLETINSSILLIPKHNNDWEKIEKYLYKELLNKINDYKNKLFESKFENNIFKDILITNLNSDMYLKNFVIQKIDYTNESKEKIIIKDNYYRISDRYNFLTFILYLNDIDKGGELYFDDGSSIYSEKGKLILLPDDIQYLYNIVPPISNEQYIITGQICIKNNIN